jgi:hypothetical protein
MSNDEDTRSWIESVLPESEIVDRISYLETRASEFSREAEALRLILQGRRLIVDGPPRVRAVESVKAYGGGVARPMRDDVTESNSATTSRPSTSQAVLQVLSEAPGNAMSAKEIMRALEIRDWLPAAKEPRKALGATLSRLTERTGQLERIGRAVYRMRLEPVPGSSSTSAADLKD